MVNMHCKVGDLRLINLVCNLWYFLSLFPCPSVALKDVEMEDLNYYYANYSR
jgi:hypothetical protein